ALEADALPVGDPGGQADLDLAGPVLDARAPAGGARVVDDVALAPAVGAGLREAEEALVVVEHAAAAALRAGVGRRSGTGSAAVARRARRLAREVDRGRQALHRVLEVEVELGLEVLAPVGTGAPAGPACGSAPTPAAEQAAEHVADVAHVL